MNDQVPYNQPTATPTAKVGAVGIAGSAVTILIFVITQIADVTIPAEIAAAAVAIIVFAAGYFKKDVKPAEAAKIIEGKV